jgi:hypothetical protein
MNVHWLHTKPKTPVGITWGVPWGKGERKRTETLQLKDKSGKLTPLQTWPMAYWPDGSVKWSGHAAVLDSKADYTYEVIVGNSKSTSEGLEVSETDKAVTIHTGTTEYIISKGHTHFIENVSTNAKGNLIAMTETRTEDDEGTITRQHKLTPIIQKIEVEQLGPVRAVIKIEGIFKHKSREWLPFTLRLYFYENLDSFRIVHTFFYDGDPAQDFIKGIGVEFTLPLEGDAWNRHVRFAGELGLYQEPGQLLLTRRYPDGDGYFQDQINGKYIPLNVDKHQEFKKHVTDNAQWNDFKLYQASSDHYIIQKRTKKGFSWIDVTTGAKSNGLVYAGGVNGGLAVGFKDFWQKHPSSLEVNHLLKEETSLICWLWSPDATAMDLRHYDDETHVLSAYEGFPEMRATPTGIANTSEISVQLFKQIPSQEELMDLANEWQTPSRLICSPQTYYNSKAIGTWSLPDREDPLKAYLEEQMDQVITFYQNEIKQRKWYGYWHYGDVMHTYDPIRHQWRYDLGGFAWQNTELSPNIWLWYAFLRSGREDIFRMAEAMTRHTSEVDRYHFGEYAGLGSRHNVVHWGCGCKEARISMAGIHKFYYFLTGDERTRDLLEEVKDADFATEKLDPMREFYSKDDYPTHTRVGPDWAAFTSNWLSEWERTENTLYKDKILQGITDLKKLPHRLLSGPTFGYDPKTGKLYHMGDGNEGGYHMVIAFGAPQAWIELGDVLDDEEWKDMLADFGEFYLLSDEDKRKRSNGTMHNRLYSLPMLASGIMAYAAARKQDRNLAIKTWQTLLDESISFMTLPITPEKISTWREFQELPTNSVISTNTISQWCLNTIMALEYIGDDIPKDMLQKMIDIGKKK